MRKIGVLAAFAALVAAAPGAAATLGGGGCAGDLTLASGSVLAGCDGRFGKNMLNNNSNDVINQALTALGYAGPAVTFGDLPSTSIISGLGGAHVVDYAGLLNGVVYLGVHYGNGQGGPGNTTTFYKLNAADLDVITLNLNASSNAVLLANTPGVPEPATWGMMIAGFGLMGAALRRPRRRIAVA